MVWEFLKVMRRAVNVTCVFLLAGVYVLTYYDYLQTVTANNGVTISNPAPASATRQ